MRFKRNLSICTKVHSYFSFHLPTSQLYISRGKKLWRHISFCFYRKHANNDDEICPLPSSSCLQQYCHDWFYVLSYNSDLSKLEWALQLFNFNCICDLTNRRKLFFIPVVEYASLSHQARMLKTNVLGLISNRSKYYFKTGTICLLFLSSHVFATLEFDSNHFGILL